VLDPACGDGALLAAVGARAPQAVLVGIERDPTVARRARRRLPGARIVCRDALDGDLAVAAELLVGNPPYVRSVRLRASDPALWAALRGRFVATSFGEWDLYGAFLERSLDWLAGDGRVALIVPSRWLTRALGRGRCARTWRRAARFARSSISGRASCSRRRPPTPRSW
jgi:adenine-specific DNA-methyltransferase